MFQITPFAISGLFTAIPYFLLLIFLASKSKTKIVKIFNLLQVSIISWGIAAFFIGSILDKKIVLLVSSIGYVGVIFIPIFFYHVVHELLQIKSKKTLFLIYFLGMIFSFLSLTGKIFTSVRYFLDSFYFHTGGLLFNISFAFWIAVISVAHYELIKHYRTANKQLKSQIIILLYAAPLGFLGGLTNFLPGFNIQMYPYGNYLIGIYAPVVAYGVLKYQFLDIKIAFRKSVYYSILITLISISYLITILIFEHFLKRNLNYESVYVSIIITFFLGLFFIPLRYKIQNLVDRFIFKGTQEEIAEQNIKLREEVTQSEKYKTLATLATGIGHEIRNPLSVLKTFTDKLPQKHNDQKFIHQFHHLVGKEIDRIEDLTDQLLDYGKPKPLEKKETDVTKLMNDTIELLSNKFLSAHIHVDKKYHSDIQLSALIDSERLKQALLNIFLNAINAMPHGGRILVSINATKDQKIRISISDNGTGINKNTLKHIFDPFYSQKDKSTGLGLSITQSIIEQHNGRIKVKSHENVGSEFIIELPLNPN